MADITLSKAVRSNLLNLQSTASQLAKTQERLATGLKVNSALDNPTNFFTSSSLNSRAGDLSRLLDAVGNATQTIEAANNGLTAITSLVESAQATARQALQTTGQTTVNEVVGSTSATFNPTAYTTVSGDNDTTGTSAGVIAADAAADIGFFDIAEDSTTISDINTAALGAAGDSSDTLDGLTSALADGDYVTFTVNGVDYTLNITDDGATGAARTGDATAGYAIDLDQDATLAETDDVLNTLLSGSGMSVADDGDSTYTFSFDSTVDVVSLAASGANSADLAAFGLDAVGADYTGTTGDTGDRLLARNSAFQTFLAANGNGDTIAVGLAGSTVGTLTLGAVAASSQISTKQGLLDALNAMSGISASNAGGGGDITVTNSDSNDADSSITLTFGDSATQTFASADVSSDYDSTSALVTTATAVNLLTQSKVSQGDTIDIKVGSSATLTVTFGTGTNQVSTLGELNEKLASLAGGAASVDSRGEINITSDRAGDPIVLSGTTATLSSFGLTSSETSAMIDGTNIASGDKLNIQVGTNSELTITFGTGTGQVNTLAELETALGNLAGGTAEIDGETGAITVTATNGSDSIVISSTNSSDVAKAAVASSFGLSAGTTTATTTDSSSRTTLEAQYNDLMNQINELAEDASFNGVNLLNGNDLNVVFNEDASSTLDIQGVTFNYSGLGLSRVASGSFQTDTNIDDVLTALDSAISSLRSQATTFGSNLSVVETRQDFTKEMINTLETGAANLTLADTNEEAANLLALQTRQQLSSTALSLASQADQNVLRLF